MDPGLFLGIQGARLVHVPDRTPVYLRAPHTNTFLDKLEKTGDPGGELNICDIHVHGLAVCCEFFLLLLVLTI